jgi:hypothetical protein
MQRHVLYRVSSGERGGDGEYASGFGRRGGCGGIC